MKRLVLVAGALALAAAGAFAAATEEGAAADTIYDVRVFYEFSKDRLPQQHPYHATLAEDKFGLRFEYEFVAGGSTVEKTDLLFAAGDYYDMHPYGLRVWEVNRWAMDGHIVPLSDHWEDLPNYRKWWTDDEWATVEAFNAAPRRQDVHAAVQEPAHHQPRLRLPAGSGRGPPAWSGRPPSTGTPRCSGR